MYVIMYDFIRPACLQESFEWMSEWMNEWMNEFLFIWSTSDSNRYGRDRRQHDIGSLLSRLCPLQVLWKERTHIAVTKANFILDNNAEAGKP